ncbi:hypothetical protein Goari_021706, partial [Gossypium aridum]|nr:hypothetical protein [Gossypium aridum]
MSGGNTSAVVVARANMMTAFNDIPIPSHRRSQLNIEGELNGYSTNIFSRDPIAEMERELAVIGGRGKFKMEK